jgi:hypothetical protein
VGAHSVTGTQREGGGELAELGAGGEGGSPGSGGWVAGWVGGWVAQWVTATRGGEGAS